MLTFDKIGNKKKLFALMREKIADKFIQQNSSEIEKDVAAMIEERESKANITEEVKF